MKVERGEWSIRSDQLTAGLTDLIAIWARMQGACEQLRPGPNASFAERIRFPLIVLRANEQDQTVATLGDA